MAIILGYKGGHPKQFLMKGGGGRHILQELPIKSNQPPLPHKKKKNGPLVLPVFQNR